jgi:transcriptional regulator with XRE-family HTH domain
MDALELKLKRIRSGLRQYEVAARVGIAPCRLSEIEAGRREASTDLVARILAVIEEKKGGSWKQG